MSFDDGITNDPKMPVWRPKLIKNILSVEECSRLIREASPLLGPPKRLKSCRNAQSYEVLRTNDVLFHLCKVIQTIASVELYSENVQKGLSLCERVEVIKYGKGGFSMPHHDGEDRSHTMVVWLNNNYTGGHTMFPNVDIMERSFGRVGCGIMWENLNTDGSRDFRSVHYCTEVTKGEKWVAVLWTKTPQK